MVSGSASGLRTIVAARAMPALCPTISLASSCGNPEGTHDRNTHTLLMICSAMLLKLS